MSHAPGLDTKALLSERHIQFRILWLTDRQEFGQVRWAELHGYRGGMLISWAEIRTTRATERRSFVLEARIYSSRKDTIGSI